MVINLKLGDDGFLPGAILINARRFELFKLPG